MKGAECDAHQLDLVERSHLVITVVDLGWVIPFSPYCNFAPQR